MTVADTILEQLGGHKFRFMVGAKNPIDGGDYLFFWFTAKNNINANRAKITLKSDDTYRVEFFRYRSLELKPVGTVHEGIYCDNFREVFTSATGLRTSL